MFLWDVFLGLTMVSGYALIPHFTGDDWTYHQFKTGLSLFMVTYALWMLRRAIPRLDWRHRAFINWLFGVTFIEFAKYHILLVTLYPNHYRFHHAGWETFWFIVYAVWSGIMIWNAVVLRRCSKLMCDKVLRRDCQYLISYISLSDESSGLLGLSVRFAHKAVYDGTDSEALWFFARAQRALVCQHGKFPGLEKMISSGMALDIKKIKIRKSLKEIEGLPFFLGSCWWLESIVEGVTPFRLWDWNYKRTLRKEARRR